MGFNDCHAECGSYAQLLANYGLDIPSLEIAINKAIARKKGRYECV